MKDVFSNTHKLRWLIAFALAITACKQAGYQVLKPGIASQNNFDGAATIPPTARVEVMDRGVSVTWTYVGNHVDIRPSNDTLDPDYLGKEDCDHPGLIAAEYDLGNGVKPTINRENCSTLASSDQVFNSPGDYVITMVVKSKDNEQAKASMTLRVVDRSTPVSQVEGGFTIHGRPLLVGLNQPIIFTGICELKGKLIISWDYADGGNGVGSVTQHGYAHEGQYVVNATCSSQSGKKMQASLTVVVINSNLPAFPVTQPPKPEDNPNTPSTPSCDPSQGPCQNAGQTPQGNQQVPTTDEPTTYYYDSF